MADASGLTTLLGVSIHRLRLRDALEQVEQAVARRERLRIGVVNAAKLVHARHDPVLRGDVVSSDLVLADGMAVVWASRLVGRPLPERVAGIDLMTAILSRGHERGWSVYLLGAKPDVLDEAVERIRRRYPGLRLAGWHHGYFGPEDEERVLGQVERSGADVLLIGISSPRKERLLADWGGRLPVPVCHGVGGSFDVLAGRVRRAPISWQRAGLEWLYRLLQEPGRLWRRYLETNTAFCLLVLGDLLAARRPGWTKTRAPRGA